MLSPGERQIGSWSSRAYIDAPRERVFKAWTDPELLKQWFAPLPYTTPRRGTRRPARRRQPDREARSRWQRSSKSGRYPKSSKGETRHYRCVHRGRGSRLKSRLSTVIVTFENEGGKTKYTARVRHWTASDRETHEKMASTRAGASVPTSSRPW